MKGSNSVSVKIAYIQNKLMEYGAQVGASNLIYTISLSLNQLERLNEEELNENFTRKTIFKSASYFFKGKLINIPLLIQIIFKIIKDEETKKKFTIKKLKKLNSLKSQEDKILLLLNKFNIEINTFLKNIPYESLYNQNVFKQSKESVNILKRPNLCF